MYYAKISQGYLCASYAQIADRFGKHQQIEDYDGWEVKIEGLEIQIVTFDYEDPKSEQVFTIYSHHIGALELLGDIFGVESISTYKPLRIINGAA